MPQQYIQALIGGLLIGAAATLLYWSHGKIFGVSGILQSLLDKDAKDKSWRLLILLGLLAAGLLYWLFYSQTWAPASLETYPSQRSPWLLISAGLLVGLGTQWANGCTSGHGVCGISRLSLRSIVATLVFIAFGMLTVFLLPKLGVSQ